MLFKENRINLKISMGRGGDGVLNFWGYSNSNSRGGRAGALYIYFDKFLENLNFYFFKNNFNIDFGENSSLLKSGKNGKNLVFRVPLNTLIFKNNKKIFKNNKIIIIEKGCWGGINSKKKSCILGESKKIFFYKFIFNLIIDFFLLGKINCGKTTFVSKIFSKKNKISIYKNTTIDKNIYKVYYKKKKYTILDTPGIINKNYDNFNIFLKKINKFKYFLIFIDFYNIFKIIKNFKIINNNIYFYKNFFYKPKFILFNKIDFLKNLYLKRFKIKFFFKKFFNWNFIIFYNSLFFKKKFFNILKIII